MLGTRAIWHKGWKAATAVPAAPESWGDFHQQRWELFDTDADPSECNDLAEQAPGEAAGAHRALVGRGRAATRRSHSSPAARSRSSAPSGRSSSKPRTRYVYYPGGAEMPESVAPNIRNRSYTIAAELEIETPEAGGVIFSQGSRFGGHALYVKEGKLRYVYNWRRRAASRHRIRRADPDRPRRPLRLLRQGERRDARRRARSASTSATRRSARQTIRTQPGKFGLGGGGLVVGRSGAEPVTDDYPGDAPWPFVGGTIKRVVIDVSGEPFADLAQEARAAFAHQ